MTGKSTFNAIVLALAVMLLLAGCALPSMTPPPEYAATTAPTTTAPVPSTPLPATSTAQPVALPITRDNAASLTAVNRLPASNVQLLRWSADSSVLALSTANVDANGNNIYSATLLDGKTLATKSIFSPTNGHISDISPDGRLVAVISSDMTTVTLYDLGDGNKDVAVYAPQYTLGNVTFSPDGKTYTISNADTPQLEIHSTTDNSLVKTLTGFETAAPVYDAGYRGTNSTILWHARATLTLQDAASGAMGTTVSGEDFYADYQLSPDGRNLAAAAEKTVMGNMVPTITLWNAANGNEILTIILTDQASAIAFSADGSLLAAAVGNNVLVYESTSGTPLATLSGHSGAVRLVAFSPDGMTLASTGEDNQLILWQVLK